MNEPKKTTLAKTQLGWQLEKTEIAEAPWATQQQPYAHLLEPAARGSNPDQVQVHQEYVQQASAQQQQVQQYAEDPYVALARQYGQQAQPRTNANVQPRRAKGSTPPPATRNLKAPLFNDPTKPHSYNMASHASEYEPPQQAPQFHAHAYQAYGQVADQPYQQPPPAAPTGYAQDYSQAQYIQHANQADVYAQQQQQNYSDYAAQLQAYAAQQEHYSQQQAYAQQQEQYAYAQQQELYAQQQAYAQQQQMTYAAQAQYTQQQQDAFAPTQQHYDYNNQYAQQYQAQVADYEAKQREQQKQSEASIGGIAAKLQKKAEKQKAKLQSSSKGRDGKIAGAIATADGNARRDFVKKTYRTLFLAILTFAGLLWSFMNIAPLRALLEPFVDFSLSGRWNWGVVLAAFMGASIIAERFTHAKSRKTQYFGLGFYVLAEAIIFVPLLAVVEFKTKEIVARGGGDPNIVRDAAIMTLAVFGMLTASVMFSKKDFSFLRSALFVASGAALTLIVLSLVFGFNLGLVFSGAMVLLAGGYILYHTSQVLAHHDPEAHVAAALDLFSSVALMFWYMIRIFMRARD